MSGRHFDQPFGDPAEILRLQLQAGERIGAVGVEPGRDQDELRREAIDRRQHDLLIRVAELVGARERRQRRVADVADTALRARTGAGIKRHLMGGGIEDLRVVLEHVLRAVAVMHVEIHDRHALQPVRRAGMGCPDRDIVEQAKAHRHVALGMMSRRAHTAEGVGRAVLQHQVDGGDHRPRRAQGGFAGPGRHQRVAIQRDPAALRHARQQLVRIGLVVDARHVRDVGQRRLAPLELGEFRLIQRQQHGFQPLGAFRMSLPCIVLKAGRMREEGSGHPSSPSPGAWISAGAPTRKRPRPPQSGSFHQSSAQHPTTQYPHRSAAPSRRWDGR